jgi:exodeoxyribonuclease VII small subunit
MNTTGGGGSLRFEEGMAALEGVVKRLESGELNLEDALKAFEEGVALVRTLNQVLTDAEQRVEVLSRSENGRLTLKSLKEEKS